MYKEYKGVMDVDHAPKIVRKAYKTWQGQKRRCYNPKVKDHKFYGDKNINVIYKSREFVQWYLDNIPKCNDVEYVVGRIDHSKDYSFDNIRFETRSFSSKEAIDRRMSRRPIVAYDHREGIKGEPLVWFESAYEAARLLGISRLTINSSLIRFKNNKIKQPPKSGLAFRFL